MYQIKDLCTLLPVKNACWATEVGARVRLPLNEHFEGNGELATENLLLFMFVCIQLGLEDFFLVTFKSFYPSKQAIFHNLIIIIVFVLQYPFLLQILNPPFFFFLLFPILSNLEFNHVTNHA